MSKLNEIIVSQLPIQSEVKPCTAYLLDNGDGTHDRYVSDEDGNLSKLEGGIKSIQAGTNISIDNTDPKNLIINSFDIDHENRLTNLEGINYTWSPTNRTLTLFDRGGNQLSQVSLVSLDNEGTDIRYNASTLSLELYNTDNELLDSIPVSSFIGSVGTQLQLNSNQLQLKDSQGNILSTVSFEVSNINGLQTALNNKLEKGIYTGTAQDLKNDIDTKQKKLSSFDESILIEPDGNIEGNVSLFTEYFNQQVCELNFIPIQIIGIYVNGIKQRPSSYVITLPKTITITTYSSEKIEIQYTHLKNK